MNQITKPNTLDPAIIESLVIGGDLSGLSNAQRVAYYKYRCEQVGLDPSAKPFDVLKLNGKTVLYANAGCTQQLCQIHGLSPTVTDKTILDGIYVVTSRVTGKDGRVTENMGAVPVGGIKGDMLANAMMKAVTKAHRRTILMHCGLGMLDETEVETIPNARPVRGGNPLRQEFAAFAAEIDSAKSQEQIDLVLDSPEFEDFERRDEEQAARGGVGFAGMLRDKADALKAKLPPTVEPSASQQKAIEEYKNAAQSRADVTPEATSSAGEPPAPSPEEPLDPEYEKMIDKMYELIDGAKSEAELKREAGPPIKANEKIIKPEHMKGLRMAYTKKMEAIKEAYAATP